MTGSARPPIRVSIVGVSGSGKTTLAKALAAELAIPRIEMDAINWQAGWRDLNGGDRAEFARRTTLATAAEAWVCDGNYSSVQPIVWARATHLIWLDYPRPLIMRRVLWRSLVRALSGRELWPGTGNRESWRRWLDADHPIRWAWDTWARNREQYGRLIAAEPTAHMTVLRLRHPREAAGVAARLRAGRLNVP
jgi:adenylate kinase family enzyme